MKLKQTSMQTTRHTEPKTGHEYEVILTTYENGLELYQLSVKADSYRSYKYYAENTVHTLAAGYFGAPV